jgi:hypothetical protein
MTVLDVIRTPVIYSCAGLGCSSFLISFSSWAARLFCSFGADDILRGPCALLIIVLGVILTVAAIFAHYAASRP